MSDWEKEFDEMWFDPESTLMNWQGLFKNDSYGHALKVDLHRMVKEFIQETLEQQKQSLIAEIEGMKSPEKKWLDLDKGVKDWYNEALDAVIQKLKGEQP